MLDQLFAETKKKKVITVKTFHTFPGYELWIRSVIAQCNHTVPLLI